MKPTLGLTGLTINAMALIAPGAFLWLTYEEQCLYGAPLAGSAMWFGFLVSLLLCFATAISYAELSKLYPGAGSSYFYAEQAFLSKTHAFKFARLIKFFTGWASHLYYWVYPGLMVGVTAIFVGYISGYLFPDTFSSVYNSPLEMIIVCVVFSIFVSYIAYRGVVGSTGVNVAINVIQITALLIFSCIAIGYRLQHQEGSVGWHLSNGVAVDYQVAQANVTDAKGNPVQATWADGSNQTDANGKPVWQTSDQQVAADDLDKTKNKDVPTLTALTALGLGVGDPYPMLQKDATGKMVPVPFTLSWTTDNAWSGKLGDPKVPLTFNFHPTLGSVFAPHNFNWLLVQSCIAILCLVGFESVTSMGEEALNPKKDLPRAIVLSLIIQGAICYLFEYFATNYVLNSGYGMTNAAASGAPIGDLMVITGSWLFGSYSAGRAFMLVQAFTVFLALIGTTLACMNTGARVTYAMGRDEELGAHFGLLHAKNLTPHRSIWVLCVLSIIIGIITIAIYLGGQSSDLAPLDKTNFWYSFGIFSPHAYTYLPNTILIVTLTSNFGTFLLYMTTCIVTIVAFREHHMFHGFKHVVVPVFGLLANLGCMLFYIIGPFSVPGMSWHEPFWALGVCALWGIWGAIYFLGRSKASGKAVILTSKPTTAG
jgi:amino acid transporter